MTDLLTVDEALEAVLQAVRPLPGTWEPLAQALRCVLAEDVLADIDLPPFDKALVDGYAVRSQDLTGEERWLRLGERISAGQTPTRGLAVGEAAVVMTGAPVPPGSDAVVMHERTRSGDGGVWVEEAGVRAGQNILARGREMRAGEVVLSRGTILKPAHLGVLASVGRTSVRVVRPRVAIVPTGDELVEPERKPGPGQIRNSNAIMLQTMAIEETAAADVLPIAPDEPDPLRQVLARGLESDVLIITGGVSAGQRDLVPAALELLGVRRIFHKVRLKPGKPLWFGTGPPRVAIGQPGPLVFGLPGNPVSGLVGFLLFIKPALAALSGRPRAQGVAEARLMRVFRHRGDRPTYHPARLLTGGDPHAAAPIETLEWAGSADLRTVAAADGFAVFPAGDRDYDPGEIVGFLPTR
ncbi:MAG TPA: gephyrin-like molybdotransferase Glp [Isosphaeraceae bacterium]|nr:gephyrin-like molybdotransferase Glp [Isosphaeraceae bacterium]